MAIIPIRPSSDGENNGEFLLLFKIRDASCCAQTYANWFLLLNPEPGGKCVALDNETGFSRFPIPPPAGEGARLSYANLPGMSAWADDALPTRLSQTGTHQPDEVAAITASVDGAAIEEKDDSGVERVGNVGR